MCVCERACVYLFHIYISIYLSFHLQIFSFAYSPLPSSLVAVAALFKWNVCFLFIVIVVIMVFIRVCVCVVVLFSRRHPLMCTRYIRCVLRQPNRCMSGDTVYVFTRRNVCTIERREYECVGYSKRDSRHFSCYYSLVALFAACCCCCAAAIIIFFTLFLFDCVALFLAYERLRAALIMP